MTELGEELRVARTARGLSREELATAAGLAASAVEDAEQGKGEGFEIARLFSALALAGFARSGRRPARLDDPALIARQRAMTMAERLEAGFELCEFASSFIGTAQR